MPEKPLKLDQPHEVQKWGDGFLGNEFNVEARLKFLNLYFCHPVVYRFKKFLIRFLTGIK